MRRQYNGVGPVISSSSGRSCCSSRGRRGRPRRAQDDRRRHVRVLRGLKALAKLALTRHGGTSARSGEGRRRGPELVGRALRASASTVSKRNASG